MNIASPKSKCHSQAENGTGHAGILRIDFHPNGQAMDVATSSPTDASLVSNPNDAVLSGELYALPITSFFYAFEKDHL